MNNDLIKSSDSKINIIDQGNYATYTANKEAIEKVKSLSDEEFEKEVRLFPSDTQTFLRLVRNR